jgi:DNA primase
MSAGPSDAGASGRAASEDRQEPTTAKVVDAMYEATTYYGRQLTSSWVPGYLASRGFPFPVLQDWQVGYAPARRDALTRHLRSLGFPNQVILSAGLARSSRYGVLTDIFHDRLMIPIRSAAGLIVGFIGRATEPGVPKYLNSPRTAQYVKGDVLFGLSQARPALAAGATPVIGEGPLDVIAVSMTGNDRYAPVAPCGTALTARQAAALDQAAGLAETGVMVAFDADLAGRRAAVGAYHLLSQHTAKIDAVTFPAGYDPAQVLHDYGPARLRDALASGRHPLADRVTDAEVSKWTRGLSSAEGQIGALRAIAPVIAAMPAPDVARQVGRLAAGLGLDHAIVTEAVTDAVTGLASGRDLSGRTGRRPERLNLPARTELVAPRTPVQRPPPRGTRPRR